MKEGALVELLDPGAQSTDTFHFNAIGSRSIPATTNVLMRILATDFRTASLPERVISRLAVSPSNIRNMDAWIACCMCSVVCVGTRAVEHGVFGLSARRMHTACVPIVSSSGLGTDAHTVPGVRRRLCQCVWNWWPV